MIHMVWYSDLKRWNIPVSSLISVSAAVMVLDDEAAAKADAVGGGVEEGADP